MEGGAWVVKCAGKRVWEGEDGWKGRAERKEGRKYSRSGSCI